MDFLQEALACSRSTILYGHLGRYPHLVKFYLDAIPELEPASEYELSFWYHSKRNTSYIVHILMEPPFDTVLPSHLHFIVLTSHLRLRWDPLTTRVVDCNRSFEKQIPNPTTPYADQKRVVPPTCHPFTDYEKLPRVDLSGVQCTHEAYLRLLTLLDVLEKTDWSLCIQEPLRQRLLKDIPNTGPYDSVLRRVLG